MIASILILLLGCISYGIGGIILRGLKFSVQSRLEQAIYAIAIGVLILIQLVFLLGMLGQLYTWSLLGMLLLLGGLTYRQSIRLGIQIRESWKLWSFSSYSPFEKFLLICLGAYALAYLIVALAPPIYWDGIHYLFPMAQAYIRSHRIHFIPYLFAMRPKNMVMLYVIGYLLHGETLALLFNYGLTTLLSGLIYTTAKQYISRKYALLTVTIFYTMPLTAMIANGSLSESGVALYGFLAFSAFVYWWKTSDLRWILLSGVFSGFAAGFKIIGVEVPFVLAILIFPRLWGIVKGRRSPRLLSSQGRMFRQWLVALIAFIGMACVAGSGWYVLTYHWTGTPLYNGENLEQMLVKYLDETSPGAQQELAQEDVSTSRNRETEEKVHPFRYIEEGLRSLFRFGPRTLSFFAWTMSMGRGFQHHIASPLYLAFIPLLFFFPSKSRSPFLFVSFGIIYFIVGVNLWGDYNRYIIPIFPVLAVVAGKALENIAQASTRLGRFSKIVCILTFVLYLPVTIHTAFNHFPAALGIINREAYLERYHPGSFKVAEYVNQHLPESSKLLLFGESKLYLFERDYLVGEANSLTMQYRHFEDPEAAYQRLKLLGVTHVILNQQPSNNSGYDDSKGYINTFKTRYLDLIYQDTDVFLYELADSQNQ